MAINCYHCGGSHDLVSEVRSCATSPIPDRIDAAFALSGEAFLGRAPQVAQGAATHSLRSSSAETWTKTLDGPLATTKQIEYLQNLLSAREIGLELKAELEAKVEGNALTKREASFAINTLLRSPRITNPAPALGVKQTVSQMIDRDGIYRDPSTGEIFKAQWNRANGGGRHLYAKQAILVFADRQFDVIPLDSDFSSKGGKVIFEYRPGLIGRIKPEWLMTFEEAKQFGALYGNCVRCGADLTNEDSIEKGIGPICGRRSNWA